MRSRDPDSRYGDRGSALRARANVKTDANRALEHEQDPDRYYAWRTIARHCEELEPLGDAMKAARYLGWPILAVELQEIATAMAAHPWGQ